MTLWSATLAGMCVTNAPRPPDNIELECSWSCDGGWYEVDQRRTRVIKPSDGRPPYLLVVYKGEKGKSHDTDRVEAADVHSRVRESGR